MTDIVVNASDLLGCVRFVERDYVFADDGNGNLISPTTGMVVGHSAVNDGANS